MFVKDYMSRDVITIPQGKTLADAVKIMKESHTNSLIVVDSEKKPVGTLSSYTLIREAVPVYLKGDATIANFGAEGTFDKYAKMAKDKVIDEIMHKNFHILSIDDAMIEAAANSIKVARKIMPVVDHDGKLVGIVTRSNIKKALFDAINNSN